jgi:hypothetical protein
MFILIEQEYTLLEPPVHLSARGYFQISMRLFTTVR